MFSSEHFFPSLYYWNVQHNRWLELLSLIETANSLIFTRVVQLNSVNIEWKKKSMLRNFLPRCSSFWWSNGELCWKFFFLIILKCVVLWTDGALRIDIVKQLQKELIIPRSYDQCIQCWYWNNTTTNGKFYNWYVLPLRNQSKWNTISSAYILNKIFFKHGTMNEMIIIIIIIIVLFAPGMESIMAKTLWWEAKKVKLFKGNEMENCELFFAVVPFLLHIAAYWEMRYG